MGSHHDGVVLEVADAVAYVSLDRPDARNALTAEMDRALADAFDEADQDPNIHAIVLKSSSPRWFCAGGDVLEAREGRPWGIGRGGGLTGIDGAKRELLTPLVAQVSGPAIGIGLELALCADIIIASETAWFAVPEAKIGMVGGPGVMHRLLRQLPSRIATGMILTGQRLEAEAAARWGLINAVAAPDGLDDVVAEWVGHLTAASPLALRAVLEASRASTQLRLDDALTMRYPLTEAYGTSEDFKEAQDAIVAKRPPLWRGR